MGPDGLKVSRLGQDLGMVSNPALVPTEHRMSNSSPAEDSEEEQWGFQGCPCSKAFISSPSKHP